MPVSSDTYDWTNAEIKTGSCCVNHKGCLKNIAYLNCPRELLYPIAAAAPTAVSVDAWVKLQSDSYVIALFCFVFNNTCIHLSLPVSFRRLQHFRRLLTSCLNSAAPPWGGSLHFVNLCFPAPCQQLWGEMIVIQNNEHRPIAELDDLYGFVIMMDLFWACIDMKIVMC